MSFVTHTVCARLSVYQSVCLSMFIVKERGMFYLTICNPGVIDDVIIWIMDNVINDGEDFC